MRFRTASTRTVVETMLRPRDLTPEQLESALGQTEALSVAV
jgi:hypothetical protein